MPVTELGNAEFPQMSTWDKNTSNRCHLKKTASSLEWVGHKVQALGKEKKARKTNEKIMSLPISIERRERQFHQEEVYVNIRGSY